MKAKPNFKSKAKKTKTNKQSNRAKLNSITEHYNKYINKSKQLSKKKETSKEKLNNIHLWDLFGFFDHLN